MMTLILLQFMTVAAAEPPIDTSKPVGITRLRQEKELLEKHKQARPAPAHAAGRPRKPARAGQQWRVPSYYLPAELRETGAAREVAANPIRP